MSFSIHQGLARCRNNIFRNLIFLVIIWLPAWVIELILIVQFEFYEFILGLFYHFSWHFYFRWGYVDVRWRSKLAASRNFEGHLVDTRVDLLASRRCRRKRWQLTGLVDLATLREIPYTWAWKLIHFYIWWHCFLLNTSKSIAVCILHNLVHIINIWINGYDSLSFIHFLLYLRSIWLQITFALNNQFIKFPFNIEELLLICCSLDVFAYFTILVLDVLNFLLRLSYG